MRVWTFLHITAFFVSVTVEVGGSWFTFQAIGRRDLGALRAIHRVSGPVELIGTVSLVAGIVFGLVAALVTGFDLTAGWLVAAYVLVGVGFVNGVASVPHFNRLVAAVEANDGDEPEELSSLLASRQPLLSTIISSAILVLIVADMVLKPF